MVDLKAEYLDFNLHEIADICDVQFPLLNDEQTGSE